MLPTEAVDLTNCDREPIHIPGTIQPHGCLLACDAAVTVIRRHSANASAMLGLGDGDLNGQKFDAVFGEIITHDIRNAAARSNDPARPGLLMALSLGEGRPSVDVAVHQFKGVTILEFESATGDAAQGSPLELARTLIGRLGKITEPDELVSSAVRLLRGMLGYDRVMVYRFAHDGSGEVIGEAKRGSLESFLGQHFPASDIPRQARQLYLSNTIRIIPDADALRIPIKPVLGASGDPLDLSFAHLRSVSPIHCEYLRNMGVAASMSVSIVVDGGLWGLIACHHYQPRVLTMAQRVAAEMFGQFFAMNLEALNHKRSLDLATKARRVLHSLLQRMSHHLDVVTLLRDNIDAFAALVPSDGIGIWINGDWTGHDLTPPSDKIAPLTRFINSVADGRVWASHALSDSFPQAIDYRADVSGVIAIPLSQIPRDYLLFFRKEMIQTVNWAGNPDKQYQSGPQGDRLTPRKSFAIWKEAIERQSRPWSEGDRDIAEAARAALVEIVLRHNEILADERTKSDLRQKMLNEELNHRVKNILALIKSLVSHPVEAGRTLTDYVISLRGRIQALAYAHDHVIRGSGGGPLIDLLNAELSPYRESAQAIDLKGPAIQLDARAFSVLALVLHELATNAAKYGSLSSKQGTLQVAWRVTDEGGCEIRWCESGGPRVVSPSREGFGSILLNRSVPFDLGGVSTVDYAPSGVTAMLVIPAKYITVLDVALERSKSLAASAVGAVLSKTLRVLLVEDQLIIALDVEMMLTAIGVGTVETASSVGEALALLATSTPDVAVLDINLGLDTSWPVAEELTRRNIPFVLASGYGNLSGISGAWMDSPTIRKPYDQEVLGAAIMRAIETHRLSKK